MPTPPRVGEDVVEPHTESPADHEELYFVARGHAALAALARAIELRPDCAGWARDDEDFASLRERAEFVALTSGGE